MPVKEPTKKEKVAAIKRSACLFVEWADRRLKAWLGDKGVETKHIAPVSYDATILSTGDHRIQVAQYLRDLGYRNVKEVVS